MIKLALLSFACGALLLAQPNNQDQRKQELEYTRAHYTKYEYRIPMRDGVKLFTSVYVPKDTAQPYPILMQRTPYSVAPYGIDNYRPVLGPSESFTKEGFIFVYQDVRGRYLSEGTFIDVPPHKTHLDGPQGHRRKHRHLRHHRLAGQECPQQQRQASASGAFPIPAFTPRSA